MNLKLIAVRNPKGQEILVRHSDGVHSLNPYGYLNILENAYEEKDMEIFKEENINPNDEWVKERYDLYLVSLLPVDRGDFMYDEYADRAGLPYVRENVSSNTYDADGFYKVLGTTDRSIIDVTDEMFDISDDVIAMQFRYEVRFRKRFMLYQPVDVIDLGN